MVGDPSIDQCPIWWWEWGVVGDLSVDQCPCMVVGVGCGG